MKFIAGLRVWGNWKIGENVLKVFLRLRGSANRRVDLFLPLIASIPWSPSIRAARLPGKDGPGLGLDDPKEMNGPDVVFIFGTYLVR